MFPMMGYWLAFSNWKFWLGMPAPTVTLTIGTPPALDLTRDLPGDYMQLATGATGSTWAALFAVTAVVYAACLFASGWRQMHNAERNA